MKLGFSGTRRVPFLSLMQTLTDTDKQCFLLAAAILTNVFAFFTFAIVIHHTSDSRTDKIKSTALIAQKSYVLISGKTFPVDLTVSFIGVPISNNHSTSR